MAIHAQSQGTDSEANTLMLVVSASALFPRLHPSERSDAPAIVGCDRVASGVARRIAALARRHRQKSAEALTTYACLAPLGSPGR